MSIKRGAVVLVALVLSSCAPFPDYKLTITNKTGGELRDLEVLFADAQMRHQSLGPNEMLSLRPSPSRDGGISISYLEEGQHVHHDLGYVAPPISMECEFQIMSDDVTGECN
jgi:hypothetical protein